ncbi:MAG: DUF4287 domain-containing protein [Candidatus Acidiferrales bacterium]
MPTKNQRSMSDAAVAAKTGKTWRQWLRILDKGGARKMRHRDIAALLRSQYKLPGWWSQMITVEYERARGLRDVHQTASGYEAGISRTFDAPVSTLYKAWMDARLRRRWLGSHKLSVTTANPGKNLRMAWGTHGERVEVYFTAKGTRRAQMTVQHRKLAAAKDVAAQKQFWSVALGRLGRITRGSAPDGFRRPGL